MRRMMAVIFILAAAGIMSANATSVSVSRVCLDAAENLSAALDDLARDFTKKGDATEEALSGSLLRPVDSAKRTQQLADRLYQRIQRYSEALDLNVRTIDDALISPNDTALTPVKPCCSVSAETLSYSAKFGTSIDSAGPCSVNGPGRVKSTFWDAVTGSFRRNLLGAPSGLKWQYYIPENTGQQEEEKERPPHLEFPTARLSCGLAGDARHKRQYFQTATRGGGGPTGRAVVIAFDRGGAMTERQLDLSRAVVRYVLATISDRDLIGFVAAAAGGKGGVYTPLQPTPRDCLLKSLVPASVEAVLRLSKFVNVVQRSDDEATDHAAALSAVAEMAGNTRGVEGNVQVLYLTNGNNFPADLPNIFNGSDIVVDGYLLNADEEKGSNLRKFSAKTGGRMKIIDTTMDLASKIGNYFGETKGNVESGETFAFSPTWDPVGGWTVFSLTRNVPNGGVAGVDVHAAELLEDFIYFDGGAGASYPILVERVGGSKFEVVYHPATFGPDSPTVGTLLEELEGGNIGTLERREMGSHQSGKKTVRDWDTSIDWKWVDGTPYTVIIVTGRKTASDSKVGAEVSPSPKAAADLLFHRLDMAKNAATCRYFSSAANVDRSTLFLGPEAFDWPSRHLGRDPAFAVNSYMAFLTDETRLITNPGLKDGVREAVSVAADIADGFKSSGGGVSKFVIRRFVATSNGVFVSYPGSVMPRGFHPLREQWYRKALEMRGRTVLTSRLDPGGAGHIVTLSYSVGEAAALVVGMDLALGHVYNAVRTASPVSFCDERGVKCFLFDEEGFLLVHPVMFDATYVGPIERQHLNHKEPLVGKDLLDGGRIVRKRFCRSPRSDTVRRFYEFDVDLVGEAASNGDAECYAYAVAAVPGTNVFIGAVNASCPPANIFCPCSVVSGNRKCIYCDNGDGVGSGGIVATGGCECPCECPMVPKPMCTVGSRKLRSERLPICDPLSSLGEETSVTSPPHPQSSESLDFDELSECELPSECESLWDKFACLGAVGCSWCEVELEVDPDRLSPTFVPLKRPHCAAQHVCHGGAVGRASPYADYARGKLLRRGHHQGGAIVGRKGSVLPSSPVGSIAGFVMVFFLFLAVSVFCYRKGCGGSGGYGTLFARSGRGGGEAQVRIASIEMDEEEEMREINGPPAAAAIAAPAAAAAAVISPYRMNPGYRRPPPPGTDSDHGYSTMTPLGTTHGPGTDLESELGVGVGVTPYVRSAPARERYARKQQGQQSLQSITTTSGLSTSNSRSSTPKFKSENIVSSQEEEDEEEGKQPPELTVLSGNQIVVPVTVHCSSE